MGTLKALLDMYLPLRALCFYLKNADDTKF